MISSIEGKRLKALFEYKRGTSSPSNLSAQLGGDKSRYSRWFRHGVNGSAAIAKIKGLLGIKSDESLVELLGEADECCGETGRIVEIAQRAFRLLAESCEVHERILLWQGIRVLLAHAPKLPFDDLAVMAREYSKVRAFGRANDVDLPHFREVRGLMLQRVCRAWQDNPKGAKTLYALVGGVESKSKSELVRRRSAAR